MSGVLISTIYEKSDSTKFSILNFKPEKTILLVDKKTKKAQLDSIKLLKDFFENAIKITEKKIDVYDTVSVANDIIKIIDSTPSTQEIYVDVSQGRKTQAFGVLLACYTRPHRIKTIVYWNGEREMEILPKLAFGVNKRNKDLLKQIENMKSIVTLSKKLKLSRAQVYRDIRSLENEGLLTKENDKFILTEAGKIASL